MNTFRAWSGADGSFAIVVPPGRGHLVTIGPNADYSYLTITEGELRGGKVAGRARHFHAVVPLELKKDETKEIKVELRRGVAIRGKVVDADGKPIKDGVVFIPSDLIPEEIAGPVFAIFGLPFGVRVTAVRVRKGEFVLPNCDPDKTYRVYIISGAADGGMKVIGAAPGASGMVIMRDTEKVDALAVVNHLVGHKDAQGAVAELSAKKGGKPIEVKLAPCGSAEVRFVDAAGKPVSQKMWLDLIAKPSGEVAPLVTPYSVGGEKSPGVPDAAGLVTLTGLIPGATYRVKVMTGTEGLDNEVVVAKEFTVEAGKTTKLELKAPPEK